MKLKELNKQQLTTINGGNTENSTETSVNVTISSDELLRLDYSISDGTRSYQSSLVVGQGIHAGVNGLNSNSQ
jgi:hypothetical protein